LNYALHAAAGIIIAVIAVEVMPAALPETSTWLLALAFLLSNSHFGNSTAVGRHL
jgi:ZIP family zinc transporter